MQPLNEYNALSSVLRHKRRKVFLGAIAACALMALPAASAHAAATSTVQQQIDAANTEIQNLETQITAYQNQLTALGSQKETLQNAVNQLDVSRQKVNANISVTQAKLNQTTLKLTQLGGSISDKTTRIAANKDAVGASLRSIEQSDETTLVEQILSVNGLENAWQDIANRTTLNAALRADTETLMSTKASLTTDYNATQADKNDLVALKKQLSAQKAELDQNRSQEAALLAQTKNSEATYQQLLTEAKSQLASFSTFAANAGGSGLLANQTSCDSWGCYYNQRDAAWGKLPLNGTRYSIASDGCLMTAMAMVLTHYGYTSVTPVSINANPSNFAAYYPAYLLFTVHVDGITAVRTKEAVTIRSIDAALQKGPVIVGIYAYGGTHFVVLTTGRSGSYTMRDPYLANGKDISFTAHYAVKNIFSVNRVVIQN